MACAQYEQLKSEWPKTLSVLERHFLPDLVNSVTNERGHNQAGYVLFQIRRAGRHAVELHGDERATSRAVDSFFAAEVQWQHDKKTVFRNLIPALGACWYNLVHERGERFRLVGSPPADGAIKPTLRVLNSPQSIGDVLRDLPARRKSAGA